MDDVGDVVGGVELLDDQLDGSLCPICLDTLKDRSLLDVCFHGFCFECICRWSGVSRKCPLCKQPFKLVIHGIESDDVFTRHYFEELPRDMTRAASEMSYFREFERTQLRRRRRRPPVWGDATTTDLERKLAEGKEGMERRRRVYRLGLRVMYVGSNRFSRYREISPEVFRNNPQSLVRIVPWLERELRVLTKDDDVGIIRDFVIGLMKHVDLQSEEAVEQLKPFLFENTEHFILELVAFSRSPFEMSVYDRYVQYETPGDQQQPLFDPAQIEAEEEAEAAAAAAALAGPSSNRPNFFESVVMHYMPKPDLLQEAARKRQRKDEDSDNEPTAVSVVDSKPLLPPVLLEDAKRPQTPEVVDDLPLLPSARNDLPLLLPAIARKALPNPDDDLPLLPSARSEDDLPLLRPTIVSKEQQEQLAAAEKRRLLLRALINEERELKATTSSSLE